MDTVKIETKLIELWGEIIEQATPTGSWTHVTISNADFDKMTELFNKLAKGDDAKN